MGPLALESPGIERVSHVRGSEVVLKDSLRFFLSNVDIPISRPPDFSEKSTGQGIKQNDKESVYLLRSFPSRTTIRGIWSAHFEEIASYVLLECHVNYTCNTLDVSNKEQVL